MNDHPPIIALVLAISFLVLGVCVFGIFARFTYQIKDNYLIMKWRIFRYLPFSRRTININNIEEVRFFSWNDDLFPGAYVYGKLFIRKGVIIVLRRPMLRCYYMNKIFITPDTPQEFIKEMNNRLIKEESVTKTA